ncbi:mitochondrial fission regulator 2 [Apis mellifera caucasica]|uniref:Mitochondrial fission regulator 2 n=1 Tax=Apis mellifera TaxID=7460 RepID=A0A7M7H0W4_APIME|nr:mitochondrial fission regulator 2 [Apis mellifera]KAG6795459.1 mitochondrial fission regulator 2 [Apis mellifera caucasica]KAG9438200.1 mitochondrial fission regulator 2 [Apis mellifera carnica]|eukprot:XP_006571694.1 mitochondrial fission regulator 2 [Apis mellifera]
MSKMNEPLKYYGKRRSIVRRIGSMLPLKPPPKIYVSVTPLHSMTSSMINEETSGDYIDTNGYGSARLSNVRPDLLEPISFGSEIRLLALEQELQELREQVSAIVKNNKQSRYTSVASLTNGMDSENIIQSQQQPPPPPPPPPPLPPPTPHIARRASLQDHKVENRKRGPFASQISMTDVLKDIDSIKLKPIARSPGGRPLRIKRDNSPCNDLQEILRRRYIAMNSTDSRNSSANLTLNDSFSSDV